MKNNLAIPILLTTLLVSTLALPSYAHPSKAFRLDQAAQSPPAKDYSGPAIIIGGPPPTPEQVKRSREMKAMADFLEAAGNNLISSRQYASAESDFRQVLALDRNRIFVYFSLAKAQQAQGKTAETIQTYRAIFYDLPAASGVQPDTPRYHVEAMRKQIHEDPTVVEYGPGTVEAWMDYVLLLTQTGHWQEAIHFYNKAAAHVPTPGQPRLTLALDTQHPDTVQLQAGAHLAMGADYTSQDLHEKALTEYRQALQLEPDWAEVYYYYGVGLLASGHKAEAQDALRKAAQRGDFDMKAAVAPFLLPSI